MDPNICGPLIFIDPNFFLDPLLFWVQKCFVPRGGDYQIFNSSQIKSPKYPGEGGGQEINGLFPLFVKFFSSDPKCIHEILFSFLVSTDNPHSTHHWMH